MGLFLALSGVIGSGSAEVRNALKDFALSRGGGLERAEGTTSDPDIGVITRPGPNTTVMYPNGFDEWDNASQHVSKMLAKPVFSFHIHDGDFWMFKLFDDGDEVGRFNPVPEYWGEIDTEEKARWRGNAALVAKLVQEISPDSISRYFVEWDPAQENPPRAYPDDEFTLCDCWQVCDFMKRIGLAYPLDAKGEVLGSTFKMWIRDVTPKAKQTSTKPWWKLW